MKVGNNLSSNLGAIDKTKTDKVDIKSNKDTGINTPVNSSEIDSSAKVELSAKAQEMKRIKELALAGEEVNADKVAKLQKLIDEGKYNPDPAGIADALVDEHLMLS